MTYILEECKQATLQYEGDWDALRATTEDVMRAVERFKTRYPPRSPIRRMYPQVNKLAD